MMVDRPPAVEMADSADTVLELHLYIAGQTRKSIAALTNLRKICEEHLAGRYRVEVMDVMETPQRAQHDQILAIPTLVRRLPPPIRRIIGDLSNSERVLVGPGVEARPIRNALIMSSGGSASTNGARFVLRLYVTGTTARSMRAIAISDGCASKISLAAMIWRSLTCISSRSWRRASSWWRRRRW